MPYRILLVWLLHSAGVAPALLLMWLLHLLLLFTVYVLLLPCVQLPIAVCAHAVAYAVTITSTEDTAIPFVAFGVIAVAFIVVAACAIAYSERGELTSL